MSARKTVAERLAELVPGVYHARDADDTDRPLQRLLAVLAEPLEELDEAIEQLEDDRFAERAHAEALPLIAELIGARLLDSDPRTNRGVVARSLHWRRRKGTLPTLEEVLAVTSGWSAEVDEAFRSLLLHQDLAHLVPWRGRSAVLWDPIALSDPLTRRAPEAELPRGELPSRTASLARRDDEDVDEALRRLGATDAGRHAASPRTIDLAGWARPEIAVIRTSRFEPLERDEVDLGELHRTSHVDGLRDFVGAWLDPLRRRLPLAWRQPHEDPAQLGGLTDRHEPLPDCGEDPGLRTSDVLLTPTALAADGDAAEEAGAFRLRVDGALAIGDADAEAVGQDIDFEAMGPFAALCFSDHAVPGPEERWRLELLAREATGSSQEVAAEIELARDELGELTIHEAGSLGGGGGLEVAFRLRRLSTPGAHRRLTHGAWLTVELSRPTGSPLSAVAALNDGGDRGVARLARSPGGDVVIDRWWKGETEWTRLVLDLSGLAVGPALTGHRDGPLHSAVAVRGELWLVGPCEDDSGVGAWRVEGILAGSPVITRVDSGNGPGLRLSPALARRGQRIYVHGGEDADGPVSGLWSLPLETSGSPGGAWQRHLVRNRQRRAGGRLLNLGGELVLLGGAETLGVLSTEVLSVDLGETRPSWRSLPSLPLDTTEGLAAQDPDLEGWARPGVLEARRSGDGIEVLAWADRTAPQAFRWDPLERFWRASAPERQDSPNPPAEGEALWLGPQLWILGPPPLPPCQVRAVVGGRGVVAALPALDIVGDDDDDALTFTVDSQGSGHRVFAADEEERGSGRLGAGRDAPTGQRLDARPRLCAPGRLSFSPLRLRQRSLGPWDQPLALEQEAVVALDPRLGRVLLPGVLARGARLHASFRLGRGAGLGPGLAAARLEVHETWLEPDLDEPDVPLHLDDERPLGPLAPSRLVDPARVGVDAGSVASLEAAFDPDEDEQVVGIPGSPRLPPASLILDRGQRLEILSTDPGGAPHLAEEDGVSLLLHAGLGGPADDELPAPELFAADLATAGAVELAWQEGRVDLRWCELASPGRVGLRVLGGGHQSPLVRRTLPEVRVQVRLVGCLVGSVSLPPWAELLAAGCTFDAGDREAVAIEAAGARVRLRHCTVRGRTRAGRLEASSSAFAGKVEVDLRHEGFLRFSVLPEGGRAPHAYRTLRHSLSLASVQPTEPTYLVLDDNNGPAVLAAGEGGRVPGAHGQRTRQLRELHARTADHLPLGLVPWHEDRTAADLTRMRRRTP